MRVEVADVGIGQVQVVDRHVAGHGDPAGAGATIISSAAALEIRVMCIRTPVSRASCRMV
jgi:hypothetical protein